MASVRMGNILPRRNQGSCVLSLPCRDPLDHEILVRLVSLLLDLLLC